MNAPALSPSVFTFTQQAVRVLVRDGDPWFVAADVCGALGLGDASKACSRLDDDERGTNTVRTPSGDQQMLVINESGLYSLILTSRKPAAKKFKKWVTAEVLPAIRRTGRYEMAPPVRPAEGLTQAELNQIALLIRSASVGWALGDATSQAIHNRLRVVFGLRSTADLRPEQFHAACELLRVQAHASNDFLGFLMELRNWFNREVAGGGTPWTPAIKRRLAQQMKTRIELPAQVDWLALAKTTTHTPDTH